MAWIDLTQGPVTLTVPATGDRYWSAALMDMYSNNNAVIGLRTTGGGGGRYRQALVVQAVYKPYAWC